MKKDLEFRSKLEIVLDKYFPKIEEEGEEKRLNKRSEALVLYTEAVLLHEQPLNDILHKYILTQDQVHAQYGIVVSHPVVVTLELPSKDETDYIVWDLETTGFVAPEAKIVEIGCFEIMKSGEVKTHHWILNNNIDISEEITKINGFTREICEKEGRDPAECLNEFIEVIKRAPLNITHNGIRFDIPFLVAYTKDIFKMEDYVADNMLRTLREKAFDTAVHYKAKKLGNMVQNPDETFLQFADRTMNIRMTGVKYNLGLICQEEGVDTSNVTLHRALGDVWCTHEIYKKIK